MSDIEKIKELLSQATEFDQQARACRCEAGRLLAERRSKIRGNYYSALGLDERSANLLCRMGLAQEFFHIP